MDQKKVSINLVIIVLIISLMGGFILHSEYKYPEHLILVRSESYDQISGEEIIERYDSFLLVKTSRSDIRNAIELNEHTKINVKGHVIDTSKEKESDHSESSTFLVHMIGPVKADWRLELESLGANIINYIPNYAYHVDIPSNKLDEIKGLYYVDWIGSYKPQYKLAENLSTGMVSIELLKDSTRTIEKLEAVSDIHFIRTSGNNIEIITRVEKMETLTNIADIKDVLYIKNVQKNTLKSEMSSQILGGYWDQENPSSIYRATGDFGTYVNHLGYTGKNITIAIADTGLGNGTTGNAGHNDFTGRVIGGTDFGGYGGNWADDYGHGTHCAGLAAGDTYNGNGVQYGGHAPYYVSQGLAYDSYLYIQKLFDSNLSWISPVSYYDIIQDAKRNGQAYVHSDSWGEENGDGVYETSDKEFDEAVRDSDALSIGNQPMVIIVSAGNGGPNFKTLASPANGKNVITVGATETYMPDANQHGSYVSSNDPYQVTSFSSRGWTQDNRVKPTIVAPGHVSLSTSTPNVSDSNLLGLYSDDNRYEWASGTSQATPTVAGAAAVLSEYHNRTYNKLPSPAMVKALLINSARDLNVDHDGDSRVDHIPNKFEGWGLVDLTNIIGNNTSMILHDQTSELQTGQNDEYFINYKDGNKPLKVTLTWTDKEAQSGDDPTLKNDLNLEVISPTGKTYKGNAFVNGFTKSGIGTISDFDSDDDGYDDTNVVENIYIPPNELEKGMYKVKIQGYNVPEDADNDGLSDQDYALTMWNAENITSDGKIKFTQNKYAPEDSVNITLLDQDLSGTGTVEIEVNSDTEQTGETVTLYEGDVPGRFIGDIKISESDVNGTLNVTHGDQIRAVYNDEDTGDGSSEVKTATALIDGAPPTILDIDTISRLATKLTVTTDEPCITRVTYGVNGEFNKVKQNNTVDSVHSLYLDDLVPGVEYDFYIYVLDEVGNWKVYNNDENYYHFESTNNDDMELGDIGWSPGKQWSIVDTDSYSGNHSWNFGQGDYGTELDSSLISPVIDVRRWDNISMTWFHRYDFERGWDGGIVEINNGSGWDKLELEGGYDEAIQEGQNNPLEGQTAFTGYRDWEMEEVELTEYSKDSSIQVRFRVGTDNYDTWDEGWWIDNITIKGSIEPKAQFTFRPSSPTVLDSVRFIDESYDLDSEIVNYTWIFGDGEISYEQNPSHQYNDLGSYTVSLKVIDDTGIVSTRKKTLQVVNAKPIPDFNYTPAEPTVRNQINFNDMSNDPDGDIVNYTWEFDDGDISYQKDPVHKFSESGTYYVTLTVTDNRGEDNFTTQQVNIRNLPPKVVLTFTTTELYTEEEIQFRDESSDIDGSIVSRTWEFGDGTISENENPVHIYQEPGEYTVNLTVRDNSGKANTTSKELIIERSVPIADFILNQKKVNVGEEVQFIDNSTPRGSDIVSWEWNFGDGTSASIKNPSHGFNEEGKYYVRLTVTDSDGDTDIVVKTVEVVDKTTEIPWMLISVIIIVIASSMAVTWFVIKQFHK